MKVLQMDMGVCQTQQGAVYKHNKVLLDGLSAVNGEEYATTLRPYHMDTTDCSTNGDTNKLL